MIPLWMQFICPCISQLFRVLIIDWILSQAISASTEMIMRFHPCMPLYSGLYLLIYICLICSAFLDKACLIMLDDIFMFLEIGL